MTESKRKKTDRALRRQLQQEAFRSRPGFSQQLHQRFCSAIFKCPRSVDDKSQSDDMRHVDALPLIVRNNHPNGTARYGRRLNRYLFAAVVAGSLILAAAGVYWRSRDHVTLDNASAHNINPLVALADVAAEASLSTTAAVDSTLIANQWGGLVEDAETATNMLFECLPWDMLAQSQNRRSTE